MRTSRIAALGLALAVIAALAAPPRAASANVFCPATIAALTDLSMVGQPGAYGVIVDVDRGDTRSVRLRLDSDRTRYALDIDDIPLMTFAGTRAVRYFALAAPDERLAGAWVAATGLGPNQRLDCPLTAPWGPNIVPPMDEAAAAALDRDRRSLIDNYSTHTALAHPLPFGPATAASCAQPFSAARPATPLRPPFPADARSVNATGVVVTRIDVDESGGVVGARVVRSSGFASFDRAAVATAMRARFTPATFACRPLAETVTLPIGFGV